uniref:Uncharacterized protein n=1 Tax=Anguilla anguilla TaxID=7936 RepID=A0A0E9RJ12_ANGAN
MANHTRSAAVNSYISLFYSYPVQELKRLTYHPPRLEQFHHRVNRTADSTN